MNKSSVEDHPYIIKAKPGPVPSPDGLGWEYFRSMKKFKNRVAQVIAETEEEDTYGDLLKRSIRTALKLKTKGLSKNDFISVCTGNHLNSVVPVIAAKFLNINFAALDPTLPLDDATYLLGQVSPKIIFVASNAIKLIEEAVTKLKAKVEIVVFGESQKYDTFSSYLLPMDGESSFQPVNIDSCKDTAMVFFSSGTTGLPKGICLNHYGLLGQALSFADIGGLQDVVLSYTSLYWISAQMIMAGCTLFGFTRILASKFDPLEFWHIVDKYKVQTVFVSPYQFTEIFRVGESIKPNAKSLINFLYGGGPVSKEHIMKARAVLPNVHFCQVYGQTETSGCVTAFNIYDQKDLELLEQNPTSCGRPLAGFKYKVVDVETETIVGPGHEGELRLSSDYLLNGYYNKDASDSFDAVGWLRTGDIVRYDNNQCFYVVDRIKEMLKFQGWHVPPASLEHVLHEHPAVQRAVVVGVPHDIDGDHPMGLIILKSGCKGKITPQEIESFANDRLSDRQKLRAGVRFIDEIPLTPTGKIKRSELKNLILSRS